MSASEPFTQTLNELAKERTRAASERTLSSWISNCLFLIGSGITIDQILPNLEQLLPHKPELAVTQITYITGLSFIASGVGLLLIVMVQHLLILQFLEQRKDSFNTALLLRLNQVSVAIVLLFGVLSLIIILLRAS